MPPGLDITITADQSDNTRVTLHDLINTIIIGFILVTIILMFFMGATNAIFVGLSVPLSSFIAFLWFPCDRLYTEHDDVVLIFACTWNRSG